MLTGRPLLVSSPHGVYLTFTLPAVPLSKVSWRSHPHRNPCQFPVALCLSWASTFEICSQVNNEANLFSVFSASVWGVLLESSRSQVRLLQASILLMWPWGCAVISEEAPPPTWILIKLNTEDVLPFNFPSACCFCVSGNEESRWRIFQLKSKRLLGLI